MRTDGRRYIAARNVCLSCRCRLFASLKKNPERQAPSYSLMLGRTRLSLSPKVITLQHYTHHKENYYGNKITSKKML